VREESGMKLFFGYGGESGTLKEKGGGGDGNDFL